ncbi:MAG: S8 family serine peptidase [Syntrophomonadaceae bacterium]|nr:S8 family serine peptidase [Syntrophomonadaceae bacterium]
MKKRILSSLLILLLFTPGAFAAELPTGENIRVAIIDTGISAKAINSAQLEQGYNYLEENTDTEDRIGHGTAVAGLLAGAPSARVTGITSQAKLVPLLYQTKDENDKVQKGNQEMIARAIRDAVDLYGCRVINISVGTAMESTFLREAVDYAEEKNVVIVSSVGNNNVDNPVLLYYPAAYPTVIGVGSVNQWGRVSAFSQRNESVMLVATGENIWTISPEGKQLLVNGTSVAAPFVSGAAAALLSAHPDLTAAQVRNLLCGSATDILTSGYDPDSGWGILQMDTALEWAAQGRRFRDVATDSWCFTVINHAVDKGLLLGTDTFVFSPDSPVTRALLWTILWRLDGQTSTEKEENWYAEAQKWVRENNISDGTNPADEITREQLCTMLWRYTGSPLLTAGLYSFADAGHISGYANMAMRWAVENEILSGTGDGALNPRGQATRSQAAAILQRYCEQQPWREFRT